MKGQVLASVVVPTYEGEAYLDECLASVAAQDLTGVEVLISDDASTDATLEIARSWSERIPSLRIERNDVRLGAVGNVNRCLRSARGTWVKPVFQDDLLEPGSLRAMLAVAGPGVSAVVGARTYQFDGDVPEWQREACGALLVASLPDRFGGGPITKEQVGEAVAQTLAERRPQLNVVGEPVAVLLHRKRAVRAGGFDDGYAQLWDYELLLRLGLGGGMVLLDEPVARFRVHGGSETARNLAGSAFTLNVLDRLRLLVTCATDRRYRPVRAAALALDPPVDALALAVGSSWAARRLASEQPAADAPSAIEAVERVTAPLPRRIRSPWSGSYLASRYMVELLHELSQDVDAAVSEVYGSQTLAVDLADPPPGTGGPADGAEGSVPARHGRATSSIARGANALRTNQWWSHMLGPLTAFALLQVGWRDVGPADAYPRVLAVLWCAMCLAAYGYVVNDAADIESDRRAGKPNAMARLSPLVRAVVIVAFAILGVLPWTIVSIGGPAWAVVVGCLVLPLAYSPRPLRLKEHAVLGPIADAANAFILPALFTVFLFAGIGVPGGSSALMVAGVVAWGAGFGLRGILLHQVDDADKDRVSGTTTMATRIGEARVVTVVRRVLFPLEMVGLALLTVVSAQWAPWLTAAGVAGFLAFHLCRLTGVLDRGTAVTTIERGWFLYWTQIWPALGFSLALAVRDPAFLGFPLLVAVLFWPRLRSGLGVFPAVLAHERRRRSAR